MTNSNVPKPQGKYVPATRAGDLIFTAGMTPRKDGRLIFSGKIKKDEPAETYKEAARQAAGNALSAAKSVLSAGERIERVLQLTVYLNAESDFVSHAEIGDLVSQYFYDELGERGIAARAAIGMGTLPGNAPLEVQITAAARKE